MKPAKPKKSNAINSSNKAKKLNKEGKIKRTLAEKERNDRNKSILFRNNLV